MIMTEVTTFLFRTQGKASVCRLLAFVALVASAGCNSKISSKLVATKIIVPPEQGSEIEREGVTVSVKPGTFSEPAEMDIEVGGRSIKISTVTATGAKVLSANVLKEVSYCAVVDPAFDRNKVYILVEINEDQAGGSDRLPNSAIEFSDINGQVRACWQSKYVNASFRLTMDHSRTTALKLTDPNCIDPDLSRLPNDEVLTLCDGSVANGSLDLDNLLAENVKLGVVVGGVLGSVVPAPSKCAGDGIVGCVTTTSFPSADKKGISAADLKAGKTIAGIAGAYLPDFPDAANVYNDTVNGIAGTLTLPLAASVRTGNGVFGPAGSGVTPSLADCSSDGSIGCVAVTGFKAADMSRVTTGNIKLGVTIAGISGSVMPSALPCGSDGESSCVVDGTNYKAAALTGLANKIISGQSVAGVSGNIILPVVGDVYSGVAYGVGGNGSTGTLTLASAANVRTGNGTFGRSGNSVTPSLGDCSSDGGTDCVAVPAFKAADMTNVVAANIKNAVTIAAVTGTLVAAPADCAADGATSCVAVTNFPAVDKVNNITANAAKIRDSVTIAGVAGTLGDCADGGSGCVAVGPLQAAATVAGSASKILSGQTVAGISGNVTLPAVGKVLTGIQFGISGTGQTGTLSLPVASNVLTGSGTYGDPGAAVTPSFSPDYPEVANVLSTDTVNSVAGTLTLPVIGDVFSGVAYGVGGNGSTGTLTLASAANVRTGNGAFGRSGNSVTPSLGDCSSDGGTDCVAVPAFKAADMTNVVAAKIKGGVTIAGVVGDYPSATNALTGADGTADLILATFDAKIKTATDFEWFDSAGTRYVNSGDADIVDTNILNTANIFGTSGSVMVPPTPDGWDIRVGQTINGVAGKLKVACRNSANTAVFDAGEFKNATADNTTDLFTVTSHGYADNDTIRFTAATEPTGLSATTTTYYVRSSTANTFQLSTISGGSAVDFTTDGTGIVVYKWGGGVLDIWDTVEDYNNNGAVFTAAATPAVWLSDNFCGGVGDASSSAVWTDTTTDGACDNAGDECRFKDKITGLEWSEYQGLVDWGTAMTSCASLSFGGAGAWRLPTQKELMAAYEHAIYSAANAFWLTKAQMTADQFWSSSTRSNNMPVAWIVSLPFGNTGVLAKTAADNFVCVR